MEPGLDEGVGAYVAPDGLLLAALDVLQRDGVELAAELGEMVQASSREDELTVSPTVAAAELLAQPMTAAESIGTLLLTTIAARVRDEGLDDEMLLRLMARAAVLVARFETYLAERGAVTDAAVFD